MKLLIIEDEEDLLAALKAGFEKKGYVVDAAVDGTDGCELAFINDYDLILLDLNLPGMDGLEILKKIRKTICTKRCSSFPRAAITPSASKALTSARTTIW